MSKKSKSSNLSTPRRYNKGKKKPSKIEGQITLGMLGFYSDKSIHLSSEPVKPQPQVEEKKEEKPEYPCNPALARQYWYKIKLVVEKSAHVATKYGVWKYIRKVGDLNILKNEYLLGRDIDEQRKRKERIDKLEEKYDLIREKWVNEDTKRAYLNELAFEDGTVLSEEQLQEQLQTKEIDEFQFIEFLIKRENASIKESLEASSRIAAEIKKEIPNFQIVKMDSKEDIETIVRSFVTVSKFRDFVKTKYLSPALNEIGPDGKGFSKPISLIEISAAYKAKEAEAKAKKDNKPRKP